MSQQQTISVLGLPFANVSMEQAVARIDGFIAEGGFHQVATANVDFVSKSMADLKLQKIICNCDLVLPDGMPIVWASKFVGAPLTERVTGVDLVQQLARRSAEVGHRIFFLGAREDVAQRAIAKLQQQFPGMQVAGSYSPDSAPLNRMDHSEILRQIKAAKTDILLVALGNPKQEQWINMHRDELSCSVAIGIGGTLDMIAGQVDRAPVWMQKSGLEWLFRMAQEPARLAPRYLRNLNTLATYLPLLMLSQRRPGKMFRNAYYLHVEQAQAGTIVTLRGSMAENGAAAVMSEVVKATRTHAILLNLGHTRHIGADGLGVLLEARRIAQARGQQFSLLGVSRSLRRAFKYAQVEQILSATPNTQEVFVPAPRRNNGGRGMAVGQRAAAIQQTA